MDKKTAFEYSAIPKAYIQVRHTPQNENTISLFPIKPHQKDAKFEVYLLNLISIS